MLAATSLSVVANTMRDFLGANIPDLDGIFISHPKEAVEQMGGEGKQYLNIFCYQVEYGGYPADGVSQDPFYLRVNCLLTPLASKEPGPAESNVSAGENDLRIIGEVLRLFHKHPVLMISEGDEQAHLQVVLHPLSLDDINHLWSSQGEVPYRLSVAYQLSLLPVPLGEAKRRAPLVGFIGSDVQGEETAPVMPAEGFEIKVSAPVVSKLEVDTSRADWAPQIAFLDAQGRLCYTLSYPADDLPAQLNLLVAGVAGQSVTLTWEQWAAAAEPGPWHPVGDEQTVQARAALIAADQTEPPLNSLVQAVNVPITGAGQGLLYARREWQRYDGVAVVLRSNPLLVVVEA